MSRRVLSRLLTVSLVFCASSVFAQSGIRIFGAQQLQLDDNVPADRKIYLTTVNGALGIDKDGIVVAGTFPSACALLDLSSTDRGFLPPRMTSAQEALICGGTPTEGLVIYNLTTHSLDLYNGSGYTQMWATKGNWGTNPVTDFLGTNDAADLVFRTNTVEKARILVNGNMGVGLPNPAAHLDVLEKGTTQPAENIFLNNSGSSQTGLNVTTNGSNIAILGTHSATTSTAAGVQGVTNSTDASANAVYGVVSSASPGGFSAAVRGQNNGTGGLGIGVYGSQNGSGWGVYGTTPGGIGVYGLSTSGFGVYGQSTTGISVYGIQPSTGTSSAGYFQNTNPANAAATLVGTTNGAGPAIAGSQSGTADAGLFSISNAANTAHALNASSNGSGDVVFSTATGTGKAGLFQIVNTVNNNDVLDALTNGLGRAAFLSNTNAANSANILQINSNGTGSAQATFHTGTSGVAGWFQIFNPANPWPTIWCETSSNNGAAVFGHQTGLADCGSFQISNAASAADVMFLSTVGSGPALQLRAVNTGIFFGNSPTTGINLTATTTGMFINAPLSISANGNIQTTGNNNTFGDATATNNVMVVNGNADATILSVAGNPVWDSRINGDQLVTGIQKIGGSIWLDGTSNPHKITTDADVQFGPRTGNSLALVTAGTPRMTLDGGGNVTFNVNNSNYNVGGGAFNVSASPSNGAQYAANITTTGHAGLRIQCSEQGGTGLNSTTHFADFYDGTQSGYRGSIQGQDLGEYFADPVNAANLANQTADLICTAAEIAGAAASAATVVGIPEGVVFTAQAVALAVHTGGYIAVTLEQTTNLLGVAYTSSAGDYAEYLKRANVNERYYPGDVVGVKNGVISKNTTDCDNVMSISLAPIVLGNVPEHGHETEYSKVGFLGQVPVKVRGVVNAGDFIVASGLNDGTGVAVASDKITPEQFTMVIGRAWTSSPLEQTKYVKVAVGLNAKAMSEIVAKQQSQINTLQKQVDDLAKQNAQMQVLKARLERIEQYLGHEHQTKNVEYRSN